MGVRAIITIKSSDDEELHIGLKGFNSHNALIDNMKLFINDSFISSPIEMVPELIISLKRTVEYVVILPEDCKDDWQTEHEFLLSIKNKELELLHNSIDSDDTEYFNFTPQDLATNKASNNELLTEAEHLLLSLEFPTSEFSECIQQALSFVRKAKSLSNN